MLAKLTFGCKNERRRPPTKTSSGFIGANCSGGVESACENETRTMCIKYQVPKQLTWSTRPTSLLRESASRPADRGSRYRRASTRVSSRVRSSSAAKRLR